MGQIVTVDSLINDVRSMVDESNRISVSDVDDILPALNRAQNYASNILARHYESPMLKQTQIQTVGGQLEYDIPEDCFEERIEKLEVRLGSVFYPIKRIDYRDISLYENKNSAAIPYYYCVIGSRFKILPASTGAYPLRVWYLEDPLPLITSQGRINIVNSANNYVILDNVGSGLTTEVDQLDSYVNIIDAQTGRRKATFQVRNIVGNKITFKTTPARSTVLNLSIDTDMTDLIINQGTESPDFNIEPDDYICLIHGTCVPFFKKPFGNFLIQYAIAEIRRKLGGPADLELEVLKGLEQQVERSWVGRETSLRVSKTSSKWELPVRRYYGTSS